jgi:hypothetical protein
VAQLLSSTASCNHQTISRSVIILLALRTNRHTSQLLLTLKIHRLISQLRWSAKPILYINFLNFLQRSCACRFIYLWLYSLLLDLGRFFSSLILCTQSVGLLRREISLSQGRYLHTGQHNHRINSHRHPWLKWDSNPRSQCFSGWL